jgi:hypothetical protein
MDSFRATWLPARRASCRASRQAVLHVLAEVFRGRLPLLLCVTASEGAFEAVDDVVERVECLFVVNRCGVPTPIDELSDRSTYRWGALLDAYSHHVFANGACAHTRL